MPRCLSVDKRIEEMRLLFISYRFPPKTSSEALLMPRTLWALKGLGHEVTVVTVNPADCLGPNDNKLHDLLPGSLEICCAKGYEKTLVKFFGIPYRLIQMIGVNYYSDPWYFPAVRLARTILARKKFDCIYSRASVWTSNVVGLKLKRITGLPWIAHFSDPWVQNPYLYPKYNLMQRIVSTRLERAIMQEADGIVFTSRQTVDYVMKRYPARLREKIHVLPHGYDPRVTENLATTVRKGSRLNIIHAGKLFAPRSPVALFKALAILRERDAALETRLKIVLVGSVDAQYISVAERMGLMGVVDFLGERPFTETAGLISEADVLLLIEADKLSIPPIFLPSKLADYLPYRKIIMGIVPQGGPTAEILSKAGLPLSSPNDVSGIATVLTELLESSGKYGGITRTEAYEKMVHDHDIRVLSGQLASLFGKCINGEFASKRLLPRS